MANARPSYGPESPLLQADDLLTSLPCVPYSPADVSWLSEFMNSGRRRGLAVSLIPQACIQMGHSLEKGWVEDMLSRGACFVGAAGYLTEVMILKVDAGSGWFGRSKVSYHVFVSEMDPSDGYQRSRARTSLALAATDAPVYFEGYPTAVRRYTGSVI